MKACFSRPKRFVLSNPNIIIMSEEKYGDSRKLDNLEGV